MKGSEIQILVKGAQVPFHKEKEGGVNSLDELMLVKSKDEKIIKFQQDAEDCVLLHEILKFEKGYGGMKSLKKYQGLQSFITKDSELSKAMNTGTNSDWVPSLMSSQLTQMLSLRRAAAAAIPRFTIPGPTGTYDMPRQTSRTTATVVAEAGTVDQSTIGSGKATFTAKKLMDYVAVSYEMTEDSVIAALPNIRFNIVDGLGRGEENSLINGWADNTYDVSNDAATNQLRLFNTGGYRPLALANGWATSIGATVTSDLLSAMRGSMGIYGVNPRDLHWIAGIKVYNLLLNLKDSQNNRVVIGDNTFGADNTFKRGALANLWGSPLYPSEFLLDTMEDDGTTDPSGSQNKGGILCVHTPSWMIGEKKGIVVEQDRVIKSQTIDLVSSMRMDMQSMRVIGTEKTVWFGRNITV